MATVLNILLEITMYSVILYLAILLFKKVFHKHISATLNYAVWGLLILRLLIPITIDSGLHFFVIPEAATQVAQTEFNSTDESMTVQKELGTMFSDQYAAQSAVDVPVIERASNNSGNNVSVSKPASWKLSWQTVLVLFWTTGVLGFLIYMTVLWLQLHRNIKRHGIKPPGYVLVLVEACKKDLGIKTDIEVSIQSWLNTPALCASLKPKLLLPKSMLDKMDRQQIEFGIRHELTHYRRKDHLTHLLLVFLRCVYWFNPVVWLASRQIKTDMETACDASVTSGLKNKDRTRYIRTMIDLSGDMNAQYILGMGLGNERRSMEKRVRGIFMKKKTKSSVRMVAILLACVMAMVCFTTACQPTPEEDVVVGKDGLSELIQSTPGASGGVSSSGTSAQANDALYTKLGAPEHWNLETTALADKLNITADVDIELPGVSQLPAATASLRAFTQEDLDKIAEVLGAGEAEWTEVNNEMTKEEITQGILNYQARRAQYEAEGNDEMVEHMDENIEAYRQWYIDAPDEIVLENIDFKITEVKYGEELNGDPITGVGFEGTTQVEGQPFYFYAGSDINGDSVIRVHAKFGTDPVGFGGVDIDTPYGVSLTKEQAAEQAGEIAAQLTDELSLCYITPAASGQRNTSPRNWSWACVFMREINGCPTAYETAERPFSIEAVNVPINYERMIIVMDDMGMVSFEWGIPMTIESVDNPDVSLLSFDEISQRATEQIAHRYVDMVGERIDDRSGIDWGDPGCTANIVSAKLGLMRVDKANTTDYYYIPVWKFFVDTIHTDEYYERTGREDSPDLEDMPPGFTKLAENVYIDEYGNPNNTNYEYSLGYDVITINALDGSAVDSDLGF